MIINIEIKTHGSVSCGPRKQGTCKQSEYAIVKAPPCVCMKNTARGEAKCCTCPQDTPECCIFHTHKHIGGVLIAILYFLVVWLGATFLSTQIATIFAHQSVRECL